MGALEYVAATVRERDTSIDDEACRISPISPLSLPYTSPISPYISRISPAIDDEACRNVMGALGLVGEKALRRRADLSNPKPHPHPNPDPAPDPNPNSDPKPEPNAAQDRRPLWRREGACGAGDLLSHAQQRGHARRADQPPRRREHRRPAPGWARVRLGVRDRLRGLGLGYGIALGVVAPSPSASPSAQP